MAGRIKDLTSSLHPAVSNHRTTRHLPLVLFLLGILAYGASFAGYLLWRFDLLTIIHTYMDDAFYYFQIAKNLADGHFSTFDRGLTRTNGYHPVWMLLITPVYWICDPDAALFAIKVIEIMLLAGTAALVVVAARLAHLPWLLLFAVLPALYHNNSLLLGLETAAGLFMLGLLFVALGLFARNPLRWRWVLTTVAFVLPWVRLEYVAISLATTGALCCIEWAGRAGPADGRLFAGAVRATPSLAAFPPLLGAGAGLLLYFAWNGLVFGGLVPVSGMTGQLLSQALWEQEEGGYSFVRNFQAVMASRFFDGELVVALECCAYFLLVWGVCRRFNNKDCLVLVFLVGLFGLAAGHLAQFGQSVLTLHPSRMRDWYYGPAYLMMALIVPMRCYIAVFFIRCVIGPKNPRVANVLKTGILVSTAVVLFASTDFSAPWQDVEDRSKHSKLNWTTSSYAGTLLMNRILPEGSLIGAWDAGVLGYFSRFPVVNLDGVVNSYEYLRVQRERGVWKTLLPKSSNIHFTRNVEFFVRMFGITHFANAGRLRSYFENIHFETAPFLTLKNRLPYAFMLWSAESPRMPQNGRDPAHWFWSRMEPHFDFKTDKIGGVVDGRMIQIFAREGEAGQEESSLLVLLDREGRITGISNPCENWWTTARKRHPRFCMDTLLLPKEAIQPVRVETVSVINDVSQLLRDAPNRPDLRDGPNCGQARFGSTLDAAAGRR